MKYCFAFVAIIFSCNVTFAQKSVMMGKVLNESGKPVAGAELKITGKKAYYKVKTDNDGVYSTPFVEPGPYHVLIDASGQYFTTERVKVVQHCQGPEFYNFVLAGDHVELRTDHGKDCAMVARLEKTESSLESANPAKSKKN